MTQLCSEYIQEYLLIMGGGVVRSVLTDDPQNRF